MLRFLMSVIVAVLVFENNCESARILGVFPTPSISHQVVFRRLTVELSKRGHELVVFTTDPINDPRLKNYTEIDMHFTYDSMLDLFEDQGDPMTLVFKWFHASEIFVRAIFTSPEMQRLIKPDSNEHFDLILVEYLTFESTYGLMKRFNAPLIGITSLQLLAHGHYAIGNPAALAYRPDVLTFATDEMNLWQRMMNAYATIRFIEMAYRVNYPIQDRLLKEFFGDDMPPVTELAANTSLVFENNVPLLSYPRPNLPGVISIGGIALNRTLKGFQKDLKTFLDNAPNGFIYFSLGSNAKSKRMSDEKLRVFVNTFAELPYKVLWKWELDTLPGKPDNVFISKWLPQYDVLAHPNIKLFIYQGGLQSTEEAVDNAVPLIGIPIAGDQEHNVRKIDAAGIGKHLNYHDLTKDMLNDGILEVINNKSYKQKMLKFRQLFNDQPEEPVDRAVWWTEYVIRHKGALHFQTRVRHMPWYQRELLDVLAFLIAIALFAVYVICKLIRFSIKTILAVNSTEPKTKLKVR